MLVWIRALGFALFVCICCVACFVVLLHFFVYIVELLLLLCARCPSSCNYCFRNDAMAVLANFVLADLALAYVALAMLAVALAYLVYDIRCSHYSFGKFSIRTLSFSYFCLGHLVSGLGAWATLKVGTRGPHREHCPLSTRLRTLQAKG